VGWKITIITLASTTGAGLFARLWPARFGTSVMTIVFIGLILPNIR
jgi:hypothetical protein